MAKVLFQTKTESFLFSFAHNQKTTKIHLERLIGTSVNFEEFI